MNDVERGGELKPFLPVSQELHDLRQYVPRGWTVDEVKEADGKAKIVYKRAFGGGPKPVEVLSQVKERLEELGRELDVDMPWRDKHEGHMTPGWDLTLSAKQADIEDLGVVSDVAKLINETG